MQGAVFAVYRACPKVSERRLNLARQALPGCGEKSNKVPAGRLNPPQPA